LDKKTSPGYLSVFFNGILKENPTLCLVLGTCPTLAITTMAKNAIGMGLATLFVLLGSNIVISLIKRLIPPSVRIPCYIVIIAGFVTIVSQLMQAFVPELYKELGLYLALIAVNCIILGRAEVFASKNKVVASVFDALGMGLGFTLALFIMASIREILGAGTWFGIKLTAGLFEPIAIFARPAGGFFVFGCLIAVVNLILAKKGRKVKKSVGCAGSCEGCTGCAGVQKGEE